MGTTAQKLDYLNTTKGKIKDSINLTGAGITNATKFRNYAVLLKDKLAACIGDAESFVADLITNFPKGTRTGTNFQFNAYSTWDDYYFKGNTYQEQTSGKNLYNVGTLTTTTSSGITFTPYYEDNKLQYINVNGTATASVFYNFERITLPAGSYIANGCTGGTTMTYQIGINFGLGRLNVVNGDVSFTLSEARTMNESFIRVQSGTTVNNVKIYPMIRLSSITDATYEPYTNGPTPNPNYPQEIQVVTGNQEINVVGKNYFDFNDFIQNNIAVWGVTRGTATYTNNSITITATGNDAYTTYTFSTTNGRPPVIKVEKNTDYTLSWDSDTIGTGKGLVYIFGKSSNGSPVVIRNQGDQAEKATFNTGDYEYITFRLGVSVSGQSITYSNIMLEKGNQATSYEDFKGISTYEINLGKNLFGGTLYNAQVGSNGGINSSTNRIANVGVGGTSTLYLEKGTYTLSMPDLDYCTCLTKQGNTILDNFANQWNSLPFTFTLTQSGYFYFTGRKNNNPNISASDYVAQIERGTQATLYTPYFPPIELCKINDYKDSIKKSEGNNLFDENNIGSFSTNSKYYDFTTPLEAGTYTFSCINTASKRIRIFLGATYDENNYTDVISWNANTSATFTTTDYINRVQINSGSAITITEWQIMFNKGGSLPYEPYLEKGKWYIEKNIGKVVLDGSEEGWSFTNSSGKMIHYRQITGKIAQKILMYSNYFKYSVNEWQLINNYEFCTQANQYIFIRDDDKTSSSDFKTWLSTHPTIVYYVMQTPIYEIIDNEELISQLNSIELLDGLNNISITSADLPAEMNLTYLEKEEIV